MAAETLADDEDVWGVDLVVREGLVSCGLVLRDLAAPAGVEVALRDAERASGRLGEFSREFKDEEREAGVCVAGWEGWLVVSPFIVEALDESRGREVGTDVLALAVEEPGAPFAGVSILGKGQRKKKEDF